MKRRAKRLGIVGLTLIIVISAAAIGIPLSTHGPTITGAVRVDGTVESEATPADRPQTLKVMTLNVAHGRCTATHQALENTETICGNLDQIAIVMEREAPDVVALQEADGPCIWSGNFNHVDYLAKDGKLAHSFRGEHVKGLKLSYGTALLSRLPLENCASITFPPSPPMFSKGFVISSVNWPGREGVRVTIVSTHLDFARASVRQEQITEIVARLQNINSPLVVMGDFNCEWQGQESSLRTLADELGLHAYQPAAADMATFPTSDRRLDWILVSHDLEFVNYTNLNDTLSDHCGVVAELQFTPDRAADPLKPPAQARKR